MGNGLGLANAAGAKAASDSLVDLIATRMAQQQLAEQRARQAQLDTDARDERAFNRQRLVAQDERQRLQDTRQTRLDDETRERNLMKEGVEMATLFPGQRVSGDALRRYPKTLQELIAKPKAPQLASRSVSGFSNTSGTKPAGEIAIEEHAAVGPDTFELQLPVSERARIAQERQTAIDANATANRELAEKRLIEQQRHNEQMEALRLLAAGRSGERGGRGTVKPESLDAVADMVLQNPELLDDFTPTVKSQILSRMATRGGDRLRNQRADSQRSMIDTALSTIERLQDPNTAGMAGAVGQKGPMSMFGLLDKPLAGSSAANYRALADTLKAQLTLPELGKMRGLGALSDREFATLSRAATSLNTDQPEDAFLAELGNVATTLRTVRDRLPDAPLNPDERVIVDDPRRAPNAAPAGNTRGAQGRATFESLLRDGQRVRPGAAAVGTIRVINGQRARWDGKGWVAADR